MTKSNGKEIEPFPYPWTFANLVGPLDIVDELLEYDYVLFIDVPFDEGEEKIMAYISRNYPDGEAAIGEEAKTGKVILVISDPPSSTLWIHYEQNYQGGSQ